MEFPKEVQHHSGQVRCEGPLADTMVLQVWHTGASSEDDALYMVGPLPQVLLSQAVAEALVQFGPVPQTQLVRQGLALED